MLGLCQTFFVDLQYNYVTGQETTWAVSNVGLGFVILEYCFIDGYTCTFSYLKLLQKIFTVDK